MGAIPAARLNMVFKVESPGYTTRHGTLCGAGGVRRMFCSNMIFIFSSPRSGSTWIAKAFDSHPDTIYLHEPDIIDRGYDLLPHWFDGDAGEYQDRARQYLERLARNRSLRTVGTRPFFPKNYRGATARGIRTGLIYAGKGLEKAGITSLSDHMAIPDVKRLGTHPRIVIKSVSALGRVEALTQSGKAISPVLLLRNPCAYVHSYLRGNRMGVMRAPPRLGRLLHTRSALRLDADASADGTDDWVTRLAWEWLLANCEARAAVDRAGGAIVRYEDVAAAPEPSLRSLFAALNLDWSEQTTDFLKISAASEGSYYSLARNPMIAANKWKTEMASDQIEKVRKIVCQDPLGEQYFG